MEIYLTDGQEIFLRTLDEHGIRFVLTGGIAVQYYVPDPGILAAGRIARDLDVWIDRKATSLCEGFVKALKALRHEANFPCEELSQPNKQIPIQLYDIDVVTSVPDLDFEDAYAASECLELKRNGAAINLHIMSKSQLIVCKRERGEKKDLEDIRLLENT